MMRTCPTCGDFYSDDLLAFCLSDGTPLVSVAPHGERWVEGQRVIEEKERAERKQRRRLKWRRVVLTAMTMMMAAAVVFVVTVNGFIYLKPQPEAESARAEPSSSPLAPDSPGAPVIPGMTEETRPTSWPGVKPSPTPSPNTSTVTGPTPTPTPRPVPTATPVVNPTPFVTTVPAVCSEEEKSREREAIISGYGDAWRRNIEGERQRIISENSPARSQEAEASLGALEYASSFSQSCRAGFVMVRYVWRVRVNLNGTIKVLSIPKEKRFACTKVGASWLCR
jgi:hypothetical protein